MKAVGKDGVEGKYKMESTCPKGVRTGEGDRAGRHDGKFYGIAG